MRKTIWQAILWLIILGGIYLLLPASEIAAARAWVEAVIGRFR